MASRATSSLSKLSLDPKKKAGGAKAKEPIADSWEDEDEDDDEVEGSAPASKEDPDASGFQAPPPTPASPTYSSGAPWQSMTEPTSSPSRDAARRPEKTDAVARRLIAGALGVKAPKQTEEQKAYDRALREKEKKKKEEEKEAEKRRQEEVERAKAAIWND